MLSLAREELYHCLKNCLIRTAGIEEDVEESIKEIVEIALKKLDKDKNGQVTFSDFYAAVQADNLLLEACGPCLPSPKTIGNFFLFLKERYPVVVQSARGRRGGKLRQEERSLLSAGRDYEQGAGETDVLAQFLKHHRRKKEREKVASTKALATRKTSVE
ncbi:EF-hand calcium-binding domain-containing protein 1 [Orchesella cincta]|uniref:EF-hand calcium-binding domain-containing protein 1 n=1 Tax=Orchesella cincta TaxID=48709 RepID=A0A1D2NLA7_ORCCI|nr:EF-hand calcium-binding domain-containing protein 1 [Orchesella cincta]